MSAGANDPRANAASALVRDARELGCEVTESQALGLLTLLDELVRWNKAYNLTSITTPEEMVTHHLLDSLSVHRFLSGERIADVGTGGGFPGLPLAIANPARRFTLIDTVAKKIRFVAHAARTLGLANVEAQHARVETLDVAPYDVVVARAFAPLPELLRLVAPLCGPDTRVLAMKGRSPDEEIRGVSAEWHVAGATSVAVPRLREERHVVEIVRVR